MIGVLRAMVATMRTTLRKPVTIQYPDVHREIPERNKGLPLLLWDFDGDEPFCTGCHGRQGQGHHPQKGAGHRR